MILLGHYQGYTYNDIFLFYNNVKLGHMDPKLQKKIIKHFPNFAVHYYAKILDKSALEFNKETILKYIDLKLDMKLDIEEDRAFTRNLNGFGSVLEFHNLKWEEFDELFLVQHLLSQF